MDFNPSVYTKFRSKLFSMEADRYLVQKLLELGGSNMPAVRDLVRGESMFRFDHFFRSRTESELSKRMLSLYKLIEKERDICINGVDTTALKDRENKREKKMQKMKLKEAEIMEKLRMNGDKTNGQDKKPDPKNSNKQIITIEDDDEPVAA